MLILRQYLTAEAVRKNHEELDLMNWLGLEDKVTYFWYFSRPPLIAFKGNSGTGERL
jgi:hypothetical protein